MTAIRQLARDDCPEAAGLLARAMADNPLHLRVFGRDEARREARLRRFFTVLLDHVLLHGHLLGAHLRTPPTPASPGGERLVGVLGLLRPGRCRPGPVERLGMGARLLPAMPPWTLWRVRCWLAAWERRDPTAPHWHLGPLAVCPEDRRQGIATALMQAGCTLIEAADLAPTWLETDLERNVLFYRRFGFAVTRREAVLGAETRFMMRNAAIPAPAVPGARTGPGEDA